MKNLAFIFIALSVFSTSAFSQKYTSKLKTVELVSPSIEQDQTAKGKQKSSCFSFVNEKSLCDRPSDLYYGTMQAGNDLDWFQVMGTGSRNKIVNLGAKKWSDKFNVPIVEPYAKLKTGEQRNIGISVSGTAGKKGEKGKTGKPGINGDGSINPEKTSEEVIEEIPPADSDSDSKPRETSEYNPYEKAVYGNMYAMRIVDENNDFYVVFRVDKLERGKKVKISWKRVLAPENTGKL